MASPSSYCIQVRPPFTPSPPPQPHPPHIRGGVPSGTILIVMKEYREGDCTVLLLSNSAACAAGFVRTDMTRFRCPPLLSILTHLPC